MSTEKRPLGSCLVPTFTVPRLNWSDPKHSLSVELELLPAHEITRSGAFGLPTSLSASTRSSQLPPVSILTRPNHISKPTLPNQGKPNLEVNGSLPPLPARPTVSETNSVVPSFSGIADTVSPPPESMDKSKVTEQIISPRDLAPNRPTTGQSSSLNSFQMLLQQHMTTLNPTKEKTPKRRATPSDDSSPRPTKRPATPTTLTMSTRSISLESLDGIADICLNAGACNEGLELFEAECTAPNTLLGLTFLFSDGSTSHTPVSIKHCTPAAHCTRWFCTCARTIRATAIPRLIIGVVIRRLACKVESSSVPSVETDLEEGTEDCSSQAPQTSNFDPETEIPYFLPLGLCQGEFSATEHKLELESDEIFSNAVKQLPRLPIDCEVNFERRWDSLLRILSTPHTEKLMFRAQTSLLPVKVYQQLLLNRHMSSPETGHLSPPVHMSMSLIPGLIDPVIATHLLGCDDSESSLELESILSENGEVIGHKKENSSLGTISSAISIVSHELSQLSKVYTIQKEKLRNEKLEGIFRELEIPLTSVLSTMEILGVTIDESVYAKSYQFLETRLATLVQEIHRLADFKFNVASPEQVSGVLFDRLKLPKDGISRGSKGILSTSEESLQRIRQHHPVVDLLLEHRSAGKLFSTYVSGIRQFIVPMFPMERVDSPSSEGCHLYKVHSNDAIIDRIRDSATAFCRAPKIHAHWNQSIVRTGRLSCWHPNLQSMPSTVSFGDTPFHTRSIFRASNDCVVVSADYSQIEMRLLAHISGDELMCKLFHEGGDIYRQLASRIYHHSIEAVTKEERNVCKTICLGIIYGMGSPAVAAKLGLEISAVRRITNAFFTSFVGVKRWIEQAKTDARNSGFSKTLLGRKRVLQDILSSDNQRRATAERQAVNSVIQGTASDLIKFSMLLISNLEVSHEGRLYRPKLVMQIHDELVLEVPREPLGARDAIIEHIRLRMQTVTAARFQLNVPLIVNIKSGESWGTLEEIPAS